MLNENSQLLIDLQKKSKITINKVSDLKYLKEEIAAATNKDISFNTLRRLFGFLPNTKPSQKTLNTLSNYLNFNNYSSYLNNKEVFDEWYIYMKVLRLQLNDHVLNLEDMHFINTALKNNNNIIAVSNYVYYLIDEKKITSLHIFFQNFNYKKIKVGNLLKFAIICSYGFYKLSEKNILEIYKELIIYDSFRITIPFYFIDYRNLNGYYIQVIKLIKKVTKSNSDILFCELMEFYQKYYSNKEYKHIEIKLPKVNHELHPVLRGRFYGYKILFTDKLDDSLKNEILEAVKKTKPAILLIEIFPSLVVKEEFEFLNELLENFYEEIFDTDRWSSKSTDANFLIGMANVHIYKGNLKAAKSSLELVELDKIELAYTDYIALFYYLTKVRLCFSKNDKDKLQESYSCLLELEKNMGFKKFSAVSKKYLK
ncbi:hypothetical protein [uncultured Polaribacter sp.]|uniref:hypothetical protein n=1 Tax=uncultured Polaribacter sp. TaxID=174711 RepID=UPI00260CC3FC|nr:hypothetical protein [uncultured Polaribacter sp.]